MPTMKVDDVTLAHSKRSYTVAYKLKVVAFSKDNSNASAARTYGVDRRRVIEWRQKEEEMKKLANPKQTRRLPGGGKKLGHEDIEKKLLNWMKEVRDKGGRVTGKALKRECVRLHKENGSQSFKASCGWLRCFKKRNNISFRRTTHVAQKLPEELEQKKQAFLKFIVHLRKRHNYSLSCIGNMDETPIWIDMPGNYTLETKGAKTVSMKTTGHEKSRITVMLSALADGTKLPPMVLLKGVRLPKEIPTGIIVQMTPKSWANEDIIETWLRRVWRRNTQEKRLLVWDAFRGHTTRGIKAQVKNQYNSHMALIPGGCTSKLQPCDVSWNKPFKDHFRDIYDQWLLDDQKVELTKSGYRRPPNKILLLKWIKASWNEVSPEIIRKSFKVTGISCAMDGSEDDLLFSQLASDDEDGDPFEGLEESDVLAQDMVIDSLNEYSDVEESEEEDDDYEAGDPGSPGR